MDLEVRFRTNFDATLVDVMGNDHRICQAARVSTEGADSYETEESKGLINFLMKNRHGCYSDDTEVLTQRGWVLWPDVVDNDVFFTRNLSTDKLEFQPAQRIVRAEYVGEMLGFQNKHVSLLVTPNHNMVVSTRLNSRGKWTSNYLQRADESLTSSFRVPKSGGLWDGVSTELLDAELRLLGFFIGDGNQNSFAATPVFNLRRTREIDFLTRVVASVPNATVSRLSSGALSVKGLTRKYRELLSLCYDRKEKVIPKSILAGTVFELDAVLDGLMHSDGSFGERGKRNYFTTSTLLRDNLVELCAKLGLAADYKSSYSTQGKFAGEFSKPVFIVSIFTGRNANPRLGWTLANREREFTSEWYNGIVYCATVPNSTLYVRRNGHVAWCGNSPFEHNAMTWLITAPIFVWREFMRHRIGTAYNEESGRYKQLQPVFYIPPQHRPLVQVGKAGAYEFVPGNDNQYRRLVEEFKIGAQAQYDAYQHLLELGIAKEVARMELPLNIYSSAYVTMNARSLMHFLSLRTKSDASTFKSYPQYEINVVADLMEHQFKNLFPLAHEAFVKNGRVSP